MKFAVCFDLLSIKTKLLLASKDTMIKELVISQNSGVGVASDENVKCIRKVKSTKSDKNSGVGMLASNTFVSNSN